MEINYPGYLAAQVLVVDDEPETLTALADALVTHGYGVSTATSAEEGLELAKQKGFDLVLCDLYMNGMSGVQFTQIVSRMHPDVPVIVITAWGDIQASRQALDAGASDFVAKPIEFASLPFLLENNLQRKKIELRRVSEQRADVLFKAIKALAAAVDAKSHYTGKHSAHMAEVCLEIGQELGLSEERMNTLELAAHIHDVGKIGTPDAVLTKPGKLTPDEWSDILMHPGMGADFLAGIDELSEVASIVRHHHERMDGLGYPDGLSGNAIPFLARILSVSDAFEAMTSDRAVPPAASWVEAIKELKANAGTQFDPLVVAAAERVARRVLGHDRKRGGVVSESPQELRKAFEQSFVKMDLQTAMVDACGRIVLATDTLAAQLLHEPEALRSAALDTIFSPRNPAWLSREIRAAASSGVWAGDVILKRADGTEWWAHIQACRAPSPPGVEGEMLLQIEDVTERVESTAALEQRTQELSDRNSELEAINSFLGQDVELSRAYWQRTFDSIDDPMGVVDTRGTILRVNEAGAARLGVPVSELLNKNLFDKTPEISPEMFEKIVAARQPVSLGDLERNGEVFEVQASPMFDAAGDVDAVVFYARVMTAERRLRDEMRQASRLASTGEMLAGVAHSFGNVLMALQGTIESARAAAFGPSPKEHSLENLDRAADQVARGSEIVRRLLSFSRGVEEAPKGVALHEAVEAAIQLCGTHPAAKQRTIVVDVPHDLPLVEARPGPLQEVVLNMVLNALQATSPSGEVKVEAEVDESQPCVYLRVIDNGFGMSPETASHAFEPFFSTKGGTGLGLPTSAAAIHRMGGAITVDSRLGEGTVFTVRLNLKHPAASARDKAA